VELCKEWLAIHDLMPGKGRRLRVTGTVCFDTAGWDARLGEHDGPPGINPKMLMLDLVITKPTGVVAEVLTEVSVEWSGENVEEGAYDEVQILPRGDAAPDLEGKVLKVETPR
jgi:hypothetical protein